MLKAEVRVGEVQPSIPSNVHPRISRISAKMGKGGGLTQSIGPKCFLQVVVFWAGLSAGLRLRSAQEGSGGLWSFNKVKRLEPQGERPNAKG
jgi:hypothetical protein